MSEPKRMTPAEILAANDEILVGKLQDACECADNVDAEQQHDGSWVGSVSTCTSCLAAFAIRRLAAAKASAERDAKELAAIVQQHDAANFHAANEAEANLREARGLALEEAAKVVETIADDRFREHGSTEPDTNASYYQGSQAEFYEAQDEENENCVTAIRALKQRSQT